MNSGIANIVAPDGPWTILKILTWTEGYFERSDIDSPRLTAELLLAHTLGVRRLDLYLQHDRPLNSDERADYKKVIQRRVNQKEPVAYITGEKGFWEGAFFVSPHVLIPRPDTETLVEKSIETIKRLEKKKHRLRILDLGTGSGAVIVSIAQSCPQHLYFALDRSIDAVSIAKKNAGANGVGVAVPSVPHEKVNDVESDAQDTRCCVNGDSIADGDDSKIVLCVIHFLAGSWMDAIHPRAQFDVIVSNPPYIPTQDISTLQSEIREHEPRLALDGGYDGFDAFRNILLSSASHLVSGGTLLLEMGHDQRTQMTKEVARIQTLNEAVFVKDYAGHDRVAIVSVK